VRKVRGGEWRGGRTFVPPMNIPKNPRPMNTAPIQEGVRRFGIWRSTENEELTVFDM